MTLTDFFKYGSIFSPVLPLLFVWKRLNRYQIIITLFICLSFSSDLISKYLNITRGGNYWFLHLYGILEAAILFYFYAIVLPSRKRVIGLLFILYTSFYLMDSLLWEFNTFNTYARSAECILVITFALMLFYQFYKEEEDIFIERSPLFWFNVALFTYFSCAFFSFALSKEILSSTMSWRFHNTANMLKNVILAIGLWRVNK